MLVSIIIPVYNRENIISKTIESAISQTHKNIEILIIDNNSTDNTWKIIQSYAKYDSRIIAFKNKENIGPVMNWKRCIDEAKGYYGKILWSDDLISSTFLEKTIPLLTNNDCAFVFSGTEIFFEDGSESKLAYFIGPTGYYNQLAFIEGALFHLNYPVSPGCALFRMKDLKNNLILDVPNKINSNFAQHGIGIDLMLYLLTIKDYTKFGFINERLSFFRSHSDSISTQSNTPDLIMLYNLTKASFLENYFYNKKLIINFNSQILIDLTIYKNKQKSTNSLKSIEDFYVINKLFNFNIIYLLKRLLVKVKKLLLTCLEI